MSDLDLDSILAFAIKLAHEAGEMMRQGQAKRFIEATGEVEKLNSVDLVTEVDKAVEAFITNKIKQTYPDHEFIGEETYVGQKVTGAPTWIVDPIDGTTNFIHGFPMSCTSIGLAVNEVPVLGVIYNPFLDELYSAAKGRGAYLNQKIKLPLTGTPKPLASLGQALIGIEFGSTRMPPAITAKNKTYETLSKHRDVGGKMVHSLRATGSAALNACYIATGGLDIYWEIGPWPWDTCAAICIITEAGGAVFGGKDSGLSGKVDAKVFAERKWVFVRAMPDTEGETGFQAQQRFAKEFYETVEEWDP
ncbi:hypothetical protein BCR39DRAFT_527101 [Naematelia encephala]|uniref:Inositol-1-monophosphatase n=1 Tax=Naematelia encephala TaxID=71784 RepID=A0A1Y2B978_9TREE|nr:hypothetical protein BCR39DRAFT_527101 [Naematelia encephala]